MGSDTHGTTFMCMDPITAGTTMGSPTTDPTPTI
jgi:hypothetical protein